MSATHIAVIPRMRTREWRGCTHGCHGCGHFCRYTQNILMMYNQCITMDVVTISHIGVEGATIVMPLAGGIGGYHVTG